MVATRNEKVWRSAAARRLKLLASDAPTLDVAIETVVNKLLEGVPHPPFMPETLFPKLNIARVEVEDIPFAGELRPENGRHVIVCSSHMSRSKKRFTVAHEMAHAIFESTGPRCPRRGRELERLCDRIATELLMPRCIFSTVMGKSPNADHIFELARKFETSISATAIRCAELSKVSVFEIEGGSVIWGYGSIKKGPTRYLDSELKRLIQESETSRAGGEVVHLVLNGRIQTCKVEYRGTEKTRTLFVLRRIPQKSGPHNLLEFDSRLPDVPVNPSRTALEG